MTKPLLSAPINILLFVMFFSFCPHLMSLEHLAPNSTIEQIVRDELLHPDGWTASQRFTQLKQNRLEKFRHRFLETIEKEMVLKKIPNRLKLEIQSHLEIIILDQEFPNLNDFLSKLTDSYEKENQPYTDQDQIVWTKIFLRLLNPFTRTQSFSSSRFSYQKNDGTVSLVSGFTWSGSYGFETGDISGSRGGKMYLISPGITPQDQITENTYLGQMTGILTDFLPDLRVAFYELYFPDEIEDVRIAREGLGLTVRNIGRKGIIDLFKDPENHTLNSPEPNHYPGTAVTKNYDWASSADFPGTGGTLAEYGDHVFIIFDADDLTFQTQKRDHQEVITPSGRRFLAQEYTTNSPIKFRHTLLIRTKTEYEQLARHNPKSRAEALAILGITEEEQAVYENLVYEDSLIREGQIINPDSLEGIQVNQLYIDMLVNRISHISDNGMLLMLPQRFNASHAFIVADFNNWKTESMSVDTHGNWFYVMDEYFIPNQKKEHEFKFKYYQDGREFWSHGGGLYRAKGLHQNGTLTITGKEILYTKSSSLRRLIAILKQPQYQHYYNQLPNHIKVLIQLSNRPHSISA